MWCWFLVGLAHLSDTKRVQITDTGAGIPEERIHIYKEAVIWHSMQGGQHFSIAWVHPIVFEELPADMLGLIRCNYRIKGVFVTDDPQKVTPLLNLIYGSTPVIKFEVRASFLPFCFVLHAQRLHRRHRRIHIVNTGTGRFGILLSFSRAQRVPCRR